jgi:hypothetical protein
VSEKKQRYHGLASNRGRPRTQVQDNPLIMEDYEKFGSRETDWYASCIFADALLATKRAYL